RWISIFSGPPCSLTSAARIVLSIVNSCLRFLASPSRFRRRNDPSLHQARQFGFARLLENPVHAIGCDASKSRDSVFVVGDRSATEIGGKAPPPERVHVTDPPGEQRATEMTRLGKREPIRERRR